MSIGSKVLSDAIPLYENSLKKFKDFGIKFYIHQLKDQKNSELLNIEEIGTKI